MVVNIPHRNVLESYSYFGPMSYGEPIPGPPVEPGMELSHRSNGKQEKTLVERVEFEKHIGRYPEWVAYLNGSKIHLTANLDILASWPEGGSQPEFRKGYEFEMLDRKGDHVNCRVLTQSSLDESADVYFVNVLSGLLEGFVAYKIPRLTLQEVLAQSFKELTVPVRQYHRRH